MSYIMSCLVFIMCLGFVVSIVCLSRNGYGTKLISIIKEYISGADPELLRGDGGAMVSG